MADAKLTKEENEEAERFFNDFKYKPYSEDSMKKVLGNEEKIMDKMADSNLCGFMNQTKSFFRLLKSYFNHSYTDLPVPTVVSIIMSLLYVFSPIDLIPDFLPVVGLLDDAAIMGACIASFGSTLHKFEEWESNQEKHDSE